MMGSHPLLQALQVPFLRSTRRTEWLSMSAMEKLEIGSTIFMPVRTIGEEAGTYSGLVWPFLIGLPG